MEESPLVSIVIPAYNEEETIASCIDALKAQDYSGKYEIIVVDNASSDNTSAVAGAKGVRVVSEPQKGYVRALMRGFSIANGSIIACTDADSLVPRNWLSRIAKTLSRPNVVAITGVFSFSDGPCWIRLIGSVFGKLNWQLAGANMAVWAWAYRKAGGFSTAVNMGADKELGLRLNSVGKVVIDRRLTVATSSRRFEVEFFKTLWTYFGNDLWLILFHKPAFFNFDDIRVPSRMAYVRGPLFQLASLILLFASFLWYAERTDNNLFGSVFAHGPKTRPVVALTFDDGPGPKTMQILDTLDKYGVKATFFVIGKNVDRRPAVAREIVRRGHEIGNHTYSHPLLTAIATPHQIASEVVEGAVSIEKATGRCPRLFRPPCGWRSPWLMKSVRDLGYSVVTWDVDPNDWKHPAALVIENGVLHRVHSGSIILLHDGLRTFESPDISSTLKALPVLIRELRSRGFEFATISELRGAQGSLLATVAGQADSHPSLAQ
jgi:peptidoglycan/xylan/chitin deacetylase (PgdA/CDA1 family)